MKIKDFRDDYSIVICGIYKIYNNTGFYIGSAQDIRKRIHCHLRELKNNKHINYNLQEQFIENDLFVEILYKMDIFNKFELLNQENKFIKELNPTWNIAKFANAPMAGRKHSEKTKNALKGRKTWNKGIPRTEEDKNAMRRAKKAANAARDPDYFKMKGLKQKEYYKTHKHPMLGRKLSEETRKGIRAGFLKKAKPFICVETGDIFQLQLDAARKFSIKQGHISECLQGKRPNSKGYTFKYLDDTTPFYKEKKYASMKGSDGTYYKKMSDLIKKLNVRCSDFRNFIAKHNYFEQNGVRYVRA